MFQGRFKSVPVAPDNWLFDLSFYVHLNPTRVGELGLGKKRNHAEARGAGAKPATQLIDARLKQLRGHRWSSYRAYAGYGKTPEWLRIGEILKRASRRKEDLQKAYREEAKERGKRGMDVGKFERFKDTIALGGADFVKRVRGELKDLDRETENRWRGKAEVAFEDVVAAAEKLKGAPKEAWMKRYGDTGKWLVLTVASRCSRLTQAEMGRRMGGMDYSAVSEGLRRFAQRLKRDKAQREELATLEQMCNVET